MGCILFSLEKFWISIIYIRSRLARAMKIFLKGLGPDRAFLCGLLRLLVYFSLNWKRANPCFPPQVT